MSVVLVFVRVKSSHIWTSSHYRVKLNVRIIVSCLRKHWILFSNICHNKTSVSSSRISITNFLVLSVSLKNSFTKAGSNWVWGMLRVFNFPLFSQLQLSLYLPPWLCGYCRERPELNWSSQLDHVQQQLRLWRKNWESAGQLSHRSRHSSQVAERREGGREGGREGPPSNWSDRGEGTAAWWCPAWG